MKTISALTLGCKVNQYDTNAMLLLFRNAGYEVVPWGLPSDIALVNTCTVTQTADRKSRAAIRQAAGRGSRVCVCGCLAQREQKALLAYEGVSWVVGTADRHKIVSLVSGAEQGVETGERDSFEEMIGGIPIGRTRAYVKVQEGCDHFCSYCIIPFVRGRAHSRPVKSILQEVNELASQGIREIVLTGVNLSAYRDPSARDVAALVQMICDDTNVERLRLGSLEPGIFTEDLVARLAQCPRLCPHFHISLQSGSERVLAAMNRSYSPAAYLKEINRLRACIRHPAVTTDIITGFPGESADDFRRSVDFVDQAGFARLHVFPFSPRAGTQAAAMKDRIPAQIRRVRTLQLIEAGEQAEQRFLNSLLGEPQAVLFEETADGTAAGYSERYVRVVASGGTPGEVQRVLPIQVTGRELHGNLLPDPVSC